MGPRSGDLACVDLDTPEAIALAPRFLPPETLLIQKSGDEMPSAYLLPFSGAQNDPSPSKDSEWG